MIKTVFKKNDNVVGISGRNRGKKGKVLSVDAMKGRILVEGLNIAKKAVRPSQKNPAGGILEIERPFAISNVMLFCGKCNARARAGYRMLQDGAKERFCRKCEEAI